MTISPPSLRDFVTGLGPLKLHVAFVAIMAIFMATLAIGPRVDDRDQDKYCVVNIHLPGPFGVTLNCDTQTFLRVATNFDAIYAPDSLRQTRPGLILLGAALSYPFRPLAGVVHSILHPKADAPVVPSDRMKTGLLDFIPAYIAYTILNMVTVLIAFFLLWRVVACAAGEVAASSIGVLTAGSLLIFNDIAKGYLLSPHSQLFNILLPVFCVWMTYRSACDGLWRRPAAFAVAALIGYGIISYPAFVVALPAFLGPVALAMSRNRTRDFAVEALWRSAAIVGIAVLPAILWYLHVKAKTGGFFVVAAQKYRLLVWIYDAYSTGGAAAVVSAFLEKGGSLALDALVHAKFAIAFAALILVAVRFEGGSVGDVVRKTMPVFWAALYVAALCILFYTFVGRITPRLAYAGTPPIVVFAAAIAAVGLSVLPAETRVRVSWTAFGLMIAVGLWEVLKFGPYYTWGQ